VATPLEEMVKPNLVGQRSRSKPTKTICDVNLLGNGSRPGPLWHPYRNDCRPGSPLLENLGIRTPESQTLFRSRVMVPHSQMFKIPSWRGQNRPSFARRKNRLFDEAPRKLSE